MPGRRPVTPNFPIFKIPKAESRKPKAESRKPKEIRISNAERALLRHLMNDATSKSRTVSFCKYENSKEEVTFVIEQKKLNKEQTPTKVTSSE